MLWYSCSLGFISFVILVLSAISVFRSFIMSWQWNTTLCTCLCSLLQFCYYLFCLNTLLLLCHLCCWCWSTLWLIDHTSISNRTCELLSICWRCVVLSGSKYLLKCQTRNNSVQLQQLCSFLWMLECYCRLYWCWVWYLRYITTIMRITFCQENRKWRNKLQTGYWMSVGANYYDSWVESVLWKTCRKFNNKTPSDK